MSQTIPSAPAGTPEERGTRKFRKPIPPAPAPAGLLLVAPSPTPGMGAVLQGPHCGFRLWAPFADAVNVVGSFTNPPWTARVPLARDNPIPGTAGHDYWSVRVGGVPDHSEYVFLIRHGDEEFPKLDPYCRDATGRFDDRTGLPRPNVGIVDDPAFDWGDQGFQMPNWNELVIYEMHVGTFNNIDGDSGSFPEALLKLNYLAELGVNAVEVMPAEDFETETSMGYNPNFLFAIDDAYGTQNAVQRFVKAAHARGITVIFDVVYNHFGPGSEDSLWRFDGWHQGGYGGIYFYNDDRALTDYGDNRPDFGRPQVRQFIRDNAMMWLHEYRADGLRLDSTYNIRRAAGKGQDHGEIPEGWALMQWINNDKDRELPWNITIAEDLKDDEWLTKETGAGGAGFNSQWDVSFFHAVKDAVTAPADESRDLGAIAHALSHRYNDDAFRRVIYSESHDEVTIQNGNWLGRMPEKIHPGRADSWESKKRSTLAAALAMTAPGIPMIFQGQEFLEWGTWSDNPADNPNAMLDWSKKDRFRGIFDLYQRLVALRRNRDGNTRGLTGQHLNVFHVNHGAKVIAYHRWMLGGPGDDVVVVAHLAHRGKDSKNVGLPPGGPREHRVNCDRGGYDPAFTDKGYDTTAEAGPNQGMPFNGNVALGPYSAIILSQ
jgi:1,4-alpha-glucan branching enzyme